MKAIHNSNIRNEIKDYYKVDKLSQIDANLIDKFYDIRSAIYNDFGAWCTAKGYDMIYIKSEDFYVMLNRTKLIVKK